MKYLVIAVTAVVGIFAAIMLADFFPELLGAGFAAGMLISARHALRRLS